MARPALVRLGPAWLAALLAVMPAPPAQAQRRDQGDVRIAVVERMITTERLPRAVALDVHNTSARPVIVDVSRITLTQGDDGGPAQRGAAQVGAAREGHVEPGRPTRALAAGAPLLVAPGAHLRVMVSITPPESLAMGRSIEVHVICRVDGSRRTARGTITYGVRHRVPR